MIYAIVEASGRQIWIQPGYFYDLNKINEDPGSSIGFKKILLAKNYDQVIIGQPCAKSVTITGKILRHFKGRKIIVFKMKPKKKMHLKNGHRQELSRILIESIKLNNTNLS